MHYYTFNISDYRKDTGHLCLVEHSIYRALIDTYFLNEKPLCEDDAKLMRTHNVKTDYEKDCFKLVLDEFFVKHEDGYHHYGCESRMEQVYQKSEKARVSAQKRWEKNKKTCERNANASNTHSPSNANGMLPITYNLEPNNTCQKESKIPVCPHEKIIDLYHKILPELQGVNKTLWKGSRREKDLSSRWKQNEEFRKGEFWDWFFKNVRTSNHHMGGSEGGWKAELGWLVKKENFIKLVERFSA